MKIKRQDLLKKLQLVSSGLSAAMEQTNCYVFRGDRLYTYNDEICCTVGCAEFSIKGIVESGGLLGILNKLKHENISVECSERELLIQSSDSRTGLILETELQLPLDAVSLPDQWNDLDPNFSTAIGLAKECASKDTSRFDLVCVHIHPNWIEACDDSQMIRYKLTTGLPKPVLVRASSLKQFDSLGMNQIAFDETWLHFRNSTEDLTYSVRKYEEPYPEMTKFYKVKGNTLQFPGGLKEKIDAANLFSSDSTNETNQILIELSPGKMKIKGTGSYGWHEVRSKVSYTGDPLSFLVSPRLLADFSSKAHECSVTAERLLVNGDGYKWLGCLVAAGE